MRDETSSGLGVKHIEKTSPTLRELIRVLSYATRCIGPQVLEKSRRQKCGALEMCSMVRFVCCELRRSRRCHRPPGVATNAA